VKIDRRSTLTGLAAVSVAPVAFGAEALAGAKVETSSGAYRGTKTGGVMRFLGIRYGEDTRHTRFARPKPATPHSDTRVADTYGTSAPQIGSPHHTSEDCLFLNVWTPDTDSRAKRPVMVYIHGGAYAAGSGSDALYDGQRLASKGDVVLVTLNHRLNAFGYLSLSHVWPGHFPDSGNAGQWDLVLALQWLKRNIVAFGGDPSRIMLFGQSGGGAKIATLMATPAAAGLFHRVATMSGQQVTASGPLNAAKRATAFLAALGTPTRPEDLLAMPTEAFVEKLNLRDPINPERKLYFGPVFDGRMLHRHPFWPDAPTQSSDIPMILGNTKDETRNLIGRREPDMFALDWNALPQHLARHMRCDISPTLVASTYRSAYPDLSPSDIFFAATTAGRSWRGQVEEADARARENGPTWVYQFDLPSPDDGGKWGAPHTIDIAHAFDNLDKPGAFSGNSQGAQRVADQLSNSFIQLARTGDPNHSGLTHWPRYSLPERQTMIFDGTSRAAADPRKTERELFAKVPFTQWGS
jgi:para-nitrobenzyl esterase